MVLEIVMCSSYSKLRAMENGIQRMEIMRREKKKHDIS